MNHTSVKGTCLRRPTAPSTDAIYDGPEDFIRQIDDLQIRQDVRALHELIQQTEPSLKPRTNIKGTLGYGKYKFHYKNGREGEWCKLGISHGKQITLHCSGIITTNSKSNGNLQQKRYVLERFVDKFPKAKVGMTSLRFQKLADLDFEPSAEPELEDGVTYLEYRKEGLASFLAGTIYVAIAGKEAVIASRASIIKKLETKI